MKACDFLVRRRRAVAETISFMVIREKGAGYVSFTVDAKKVAGKDILLSNSIIQKTTRV